MIASHKFRNDIPESTNSFSHGKIIKYGQEESLKKYETPSPFSPMISDEEEEEDDISLFSKFKGLTPVNI